MSEPVRIEMPEETPAANVETAAPEMPMHWHGFLTKFLLWLAAAVHIAQAYWIFSGKIYYTPEIRSQIYAGIPAMRFADFGLAACLLAAAVLQLIARGALQGRKWRGTVLLTAAYACLAASQALYALARFIFAGLSPLNIPVIAQVVGYGALLLVNKIYYHRRRSAFGKETE